VSDSRTGEADISEISSRIEEALCDRTDLHTIIVYGSAAGGNLRSGAAFASDVDIAVAGAEPLGLRGKLHLLSSLSRALGRDVDLVDLHEAHGLLLTQILTKGRAVRKNQPSFVAEKAIEMYDYQRFFEPSIREARRRRVERLTGASHGSSPD
jgi:predicted nucleotidyltransferase